jgi:hypothetical protein
VNKAGVWPFYTNWLCTSGAPLNISDPLAPRKWPRRGERAFYVHDSRIAPRQRQDLVGVARDHVRERGEFLRIAAAVPVPIIDAPPKKPLRDGRDV